MKPVSYVAIIFFCMRGLASSPFGNEEEILGYQPTQAGVSFQVTSGGCTGGEDFTVVVNKNLVDSTTITLVRTRPDPCLALIPMGVKIKLTYKQMGIAKGEAFRVQNPNGIVRGWIWKEETLSAD